MIGTLALVLVLARVPVAVTLLHRAAAACGPGSRRIVATLGTTPARDFTGALRSLLLQSCVPDRIYVAVGGYALAAAGLANDHDQKKLRSITAWAPSEELQRLARAAAGRLVLHRLNASEDEGPSSKYLFALRQERDPGTLILVIDDDCHYPPTFVAAVTAQLEARGQGSAVGGSGTRLVANATHHVEAKGAPDRPCAVQLQPPRDGNNSRTNVFGYALRMGCSLRVDVLQGMFGIGFWRGDVNETRLSAVARAAPPYLRFGADDLQLATEMERARPPVEKWLVSLPVPRFFSDQQGAALNGGRFQCPGWQGPWPDRMQQLTTKYQLSLAWLRRNLHVWRNVDMSGVDEILGVVRRQCGWA